MSSVLFFFLILIAGTVTGMTSRSNGKCLNVTLANGHRKDKDGKGKLHGPYMTRFKTS